MLVVRGSPAADLFFAFRAGGWNAMQFAFDTDVFSMFGMQNCQWRAQWLKAIAVAPRSQ
jgi:hypothetical protein